jgi:ferredoxin
MAKVTIDEETCEGCATCQELCPEVFEVGDDGKAHIIGPDKLNTCNIEEAVEMCPTQSLKLE